MRRNAKQKCHVQESIQSKRVANGQARTRITHCEVKDLENYLGKIRSAKGKTNCIASHQQPEKQNDEREDPYFCMSDIEKIVNRHNTTILKKKISQISSSSNSSPQRPSFITDYKDNSFDLVKCLVGDKFKDDAVPQNEETESDSSGAEISPRAIFSICKRLSEISLSANKHDLIGKRIQGVKRMEPVSVGKLIAVSKKNESVDCNISSQSSEETNSSTFCKPSRQHSRVCNKVVLQQSNYSTQLKKRDNLKEINPPPEKEGLHLLHSEDIACHRSSSRKRRCLKCKSQLVHGKDSFCPECKKSGTESSLKKVRKQILFLNRSSIAAPKQRAHLAVLEKVSSKTSSPSPSDEHMHKSPSLTSGRCRFGRETKERVQAYKMEQITSKTDVKYRALSRVCNNDVLQQSNYSTQLKKRDNLKEITPPPEKEGLHLLHSEDIACHRSSSRKRRCLKCKSELVRGKDSFCPECKKSGTESSLKKVRKQILFLNRSSIAAPKHRAHLAVLEKVSSKTSSPSASDENMHKSPSLTSRRCRFGRETKERGQDYKMEQITSKTDVKYRALSLDTNNGKMRSKTKNKVNFRTKENTLCNFKIMHVKKSHGRNKKQCQDEPNVSSIRNIMKSQCQENVETLSKEKRTKSSVNLKNALENNRSKTTRTSHHEMVFDNSRKTACKNLLDQKRVREQRKLWSSSVECRKTEVKMAVPDSTKNPDNRLGCELDDKLSHLNESDMITRAPDEDDSRKTLPSIFGNEEQKCNEQTGAARDDESRCSSNELHCVSSEMYNSSLIDQTCRLSSCKDTLRDAKRFGYKRTASNGNQEDLARKRPRSSKHCVVNTVVKPNLYNEQKIDGDASEIHSSNTSIKYPGFLKCHTSDDYAKSVSHIDGRSERCTTDFSWYSSNSTSEVPALCTRVIDESESRCSIHVKEVNVEPGDATGNKDETGCTDSSDLDFQDQFCYKKVCDGLYLMSLHDQIDEKNTSHAVPNNFTHEKESTSQFPASATKVKIISTECPEFSHTRSSGIGTEAAFGHKIMDSDVTDASETSEWHTGECSEKKPEIISPFVNQEYKLSYKSVEQDTTLVNLSDEKSETSGKVTVEETALSEVPSTEMSDSADRKLETTRLCDKWKTSPLLYEEYKLSYKPIGQGITLIYLSDEESDTWRVPC